MALGLKQLARMAARRVAADPRAREKAKEAAQVLAQEAKQVIHEKDRAYAAGKAFRRTLNRLQNKPGSK